MGDLLAISALGQAPLSDADGRWFKPSLIEMSWRLLECLEWSNLDLEEGR